MSLETQSESPLVKYVGSKIIVAGPMDRDTFHETIRGQEHVPGQENEPGYYVKYPDGYESWSPKSAFENAYREITEGELKLIKS